MANRVDTTLPFMDAVHTMTFATKFGGRVIRPATRRVFARYRAELRRAERFVLDDEAVRLICHLSHETENLPAWSFLARLPYDAMWVEMNLHEKVAELERMGSLDEPFDPKDVSPVIGYLLYRDRPDDATDARWVCHEFQIVDGEPTPALLAFVFDPEGQPHEPVRGSRTWNAPTLSLRPGFPRLSFVPPSLENFQTLLPDGKTVRAGSLMCDAEYLLSGDLVATGDIKNPIGGAEWCISRVGAIADPFWSHHVSASLSPTPTRSDGHRKSFTELLAVEVYERRGTLRWIVTMLAAINGLPRDVKPIQTRPGRRSVGMNLLPYLQHHKINLQIPRDDRVVWARRHLDRALRNSRRPWHQVLGHWRIVERGRAPAHICRHLPVMVENGLGLCERCQLLIRWIPKHTRGDPAIGIVEHTYVVTGGKSRRIKRVLPPEPLS